jgi:arylformamidase
MEIYDISNVVSTGMVTWPGNPTGAITREQDMARGDTATVSLLSMGVHTATHVDAPSHFVPGGTGTDTLDLNILVGPALVVAVPPAAPQITAAVLDALPIPPGTERILFQTHSSAFWLEDTHTFHEDVVAVAEDGAAGLVARGVRLVGVDYLSVAPFTASVPTHRILLEAGVIPVEGLNLSGVAPGLYTLVCLPIKLYDCDGAPARARRSMWATTGAGMCRGHRPPGCGPSGITRPASPRHPVHPRRPISAPTP